MFLLSSSLSRFIRRDVFRCNLNLLFFQENRKVFKTGVMTVQLNVVKDLTFWGSLLALQLKVSYQGVWKL